MNKCLKIILLILNFICFYALSVFIYAAPFDESDTPVELHVQNLKKKIGQEEKDISALRKRYLSILKDEQMVQNYIEQLLEEKKERQIRRQLNQLSQQFAKEKKEKERQEAQKRHQEELARREEDKRQKQEEAKLERERKQEELKRKQQEKKAERRLKQEQ